MGGTSALSYHHCAQMGVPHGELDRSPTANTHAVVGVYSIRLHAPVVRFTVNTTCVPASGLGAHHSGVSLNSSRSTANTVLVASHDTGLCKRRGSADAVMQHMAVNAIKISLIRYLTFWHTILNNQKDIIMGLFDSKRVLSSSLASAVSSFNAGTASGTVKRLEIAVTAATAGNTAPAIRTINLPTAVLATAATTSNDFTDLSAQSALTTFQRSTQASAAIPTAAIPTAQSNKSIAAKVIKDQESARDAIIASIYSSLFALITTTATAGLFTVTVKLADKQYSELNQILVKYGYVIAPTGVAEQYTISWA